MLRVPHPPCKVCYCTLLNWHPSHLAHCQLSDLDSAEAPIILSADVFCWCTGVLPSSDSSADSSSLRIGAWRPEVNTTGQEAAFKVAGEQWGRSVLLLIHKMSPLVVLHFA